MIRTTQNGITYELSRKRVKNINLRIKDGAVKVSAPGGVPAKYIDDFVASKAEFICRAQKKSEAKIPLPLPDISDTDALAMLTGITERIYPLFSRCGFPFPQLRIKPLRSRWGSCDRQKAVITYSKYLCAVPRPLIEYVAAHELSHMAAAGHGKDFYAVLGSVMPDHASRRRALSRYVPAAV